MNKPGPQEKSPLPQDSPPVPGPDNWFACNPRKTLFFFLFMSIVGLTFLTEMILAYKSRSDNFRPPMSTRRFIRLGEYEPLAVFPVRPPGLAVVPSHQDKSITVRLDGDGFIKPSRVHARPDLTLAFLGGEIVECRYVGENNRLPILTGQILSKELGIKINVYNAGKQGNTTLDAINILLNKLLPLEPQVVVLLPGREDLETLMHYQTYWPRQSFGSPIVELPLPSFFDKVAGTLKYYCQRVIPHVYAALYKVGPAAYPGNERYLSPGSTDRQLACWPEFNTVQNIFVSICKARNITPVIVTPPYHPDNYTNKIKNSSGDDMNELLNRFNDNLILLGNDNNIKVINLSQYFSDNNELFIEDWQLSEVGSDKIAHLIADELKKLIRQQLN